MTHDWDNQFQSCSRCKATREMFYVGEVGGTCPGRGARWIHERRFREMAASHLGVVAELLGRLIRHNRLT